MSLQQCFSPEYVKGGQNEVEICLRIVSLARVPHERLKGISLICFKLILYDHHSLGYVIINVHVF